MDTVRDIRQLKSVFTANQYRWLPVAPPSEDVFLQSYGIVVPVEWSRFPKAFTRQMYAQMDKHGYPLYRVTVYEDFETRETVFLNAYGTEVYRLRPEKNYDPYAWQVAHFNLDASYLLDGFHRWIYDPAHISVELVLMPEIFKVDYAIAEEQTRLMESSAMSTMETLSGPPAPPVNTNIVEGGISSSTNNGQVVLTFSIPEGFGRYAEIFAKENLNTLFWQVAENRMAVTGGTQLVWTDTTSSNVPVRFYLLSNADILGGADSDGDGYSDGRERYVTGTDVNTFNFFDTDFDGMHDWFEIMYFDNLDRDGSEDFDGDGLANADEMVLTATNVVVRSDPTLVDSDFDGMDDAYEAGHAFLDPFDPSDAEQDEDYDGTSNVDEYIQGTDPGDASEGGNTNVMVDVTLTLGEPVDTQTGRKLWEYKLELSGDRTFSLHSPSGQVVTSSIKLKKGKSYDVKLERLGSEDPTHGYDDAGGLVVQVAGTNVVANDLLEEGLNLFGTNAHWSAAAIRLDELFAASANVLTAKVHVVDVTLVVSNNTMVLKHDSTNTLSTIANPANLEFDDYTFEIRKDAEPVYWYTLGSGTNMKWSARVAGKFLLRGKLKIGNEWFYSKEMSIDVRFPSYANLTSDNALNTAMLSEWVKTKAFTTSNSVCERGFWIFLDTEESNYGVSQTIIGDPFPPSSTNGVAEINLGTRPDDIGTDFSPNSAGAIYWVASFHTHTTMEYVPSGLGYYRYVGPSFGDVNFV